MLLRTFAKAFFSYFKRKNAAKLTSKRLLEWFIYRLVLEYNRESDERIHKVFLLAQLNYLFYLTNTSKYLQGVYRNLDITSFLVL